jgi:ABC-2 type transport system ATP-binding protein
MLCGLVKPDAGIVSIDGHALAGDRDPAKQRIGLVPQDVALYDELTASDNLRFFGALYGLHGPALERTMTDALTFMGLADRARDRVHTYSGGMKRRLNIAASLLHDPAILLLDEPTVGVDPQSRTSIFDTLESLRAKGKALLYTTHYMEEAERLCDRIVIVDHGKVIANDTLAGLYRLLPALNRLVIELDGEAADGLADALGRVPNVRSTAVHDRRLTVDVDDLSAGSAAVLGFLAARRVPIAHVASERGNLETVFLSLTGRTLRD